MMWMVCICLSGPLAESSDFPEEIQRAALAATIRVVCQDPKNQGSGVMVGHRDGFDYALTAAHVVSRAKRVDVETFTTKSYPKPAATYEKAEVVWKAADCDLAMLRLRADKPSAPALRLAAANAEAKMPFPVLSIGGSIGAAPTSQIDRVLSKKLVRAADGEKAFFWQTPNSPELGRSGGPLIDRAGRVIGICSGAQDGRGYYIHLDEIRSAIKKRQFEWLIDEKAQP